VITSFLRMTGTTSDVDAFPQNVQDIAALIDPDGASLRLPSGQVYDLRATPQASSAADLWLLGSSEYSARLAASLGMPYVFAHHFSGEGTARILSLYRDGFVPAEHPTGTPLKEPRTFLTLNVAVAETAAEATAAALPQLQQMARLRSGQPLGRSPPSRRPRRTNCRPPSSNWWTGCWSAGSSTSRLPLRRVASAPWPRDDRCRRGDGGSGAVRSRHRSTASRRRRACEALELLAEPSCTLST
jgi:alkanesulfonate monooxygenase SsuD/methylene tetrahydromethanopterin reductase-like flavin-dependent oxidoreductase (luciferase family)